MATIERNTSNKINKSQEQNTPKFISRDEARFSLGVGDKDFGKISYGAYKAIESNSLDSYKPKDDNEKNIINSYRLHNASELKKDDGSSLGFFTQEALKAIETHNTENYTPINDAEAKAIKDYVEYATKKRQERLDNFKATAEQKIADIETEKNEIIEEYGRLRRDSAAEYRRGPFKRKPFDRAVKDTRTGKEKRQGKPIPKSTGETELIKLQNKMNNLNEQAEAMVDTIDAIEKYATIVHKDTGGIGQAKANYGQGRLSQDTAQAYNEYILSPTAENRMRADALSALSEQFAINNKNALTSDDEDVGKVTGTVRDWVAVSLASYLPQLVDQTKASVKGAIGGAAVGATVGSAVPGIGTAVGLVKGGQTGWVLGSTQQMFDTTRGMVFKTLIDAGYDEETAMEAAKDEALVSSVIEGCGEILSMVSLGTGKLATKLVPGATKKLTNNVVAKGIKGFAQRTGKKISENAFLRTITSVAGVLLNATGEYAEEYSQEAVSIANELRLKRENPTSLIGETLFVLRNANGETADRLNKAGTEGFRIGLMMGGLTKAGMYSGSKLGGVAKNTIQGYKLLRDDAKAETGENEISIAQRVINQALTNAEDSTTYKLAEKAQQKLNEKGKISWHTLGKLHDANMQKISQDIMDLISSATEASTVSVGDTFIDSGTNNILKVIERDDNTTKIELTTPKGKVEILERPNTKADELAIDEKYTRVNTIASAVDDTSVIEETSPVTESVETEVVEADNVTRLRNALTSGKLTSKQIDGIISNPSSREAFVQLTGVEIKGTKAEQRAIVRNWMNDSSNIENLGKQNTTVAENTTIAPQVVTTTETTAPVVETPEVNTVEDESLPPAEKAKREFKAFEDMLVAKGADDATIKAILPNARKIQMVLSGTGKTLQDFFNGASHMVSDSTGINWSKVAEAFGLPSNMSPQEYVDSITKQADNVTTEAKNQPTTTEAVSGNKNVGNASVGSEEVENASEVLQNESDSATIKSKTEESSVEREENSNEQGRADLLYGDGKRSDNGGSRKRTERLLSFRRGNQGENATERANFARRLIEQGLVEETTTKNAKYNLVKAEAYNDDMLAMVEDAKRRGVELRFFVGRMEVEIELDDGTKVTKMMSGLALPSSQVAYVQYDDAVESPQQIYKHELCHTKWYTPEMQEIKNTILNSLTESDKQKIKQTQRFKDYMKAYKNKEDICWEEFVCDVMSGKTEYTSKFIDTAYEYWYENDSVDSYNPADYKTSTDAGGATASKTNKAQSRKTGENKSTAKRLASVRSSRYNLAAVDSHKKKLEKKFDSKQSDIDYGTLMDRYNAVINIWEKIGVKLDSQFLKDWDAKKGTDRAFTLFKEQTGYKYNIELSTMCKKGIPIFEAIDTIVKKEVAKKLNTDKIGKAEKEILYDILKTRGFEIPCAICYVEQARQREGDIINAFCNGKAEEGKLGWNSVLKSIENAMKSKGVDYTFPSLDRSIATDNYTPQSIAMSETEQDAFYEGLVDLANEEIERSNKTATNKKSKITSADPDVVNDVLKGTLSSNLKIFQVLFNNPDLRFTIDNDLLYSSDTTMNLAYAHQPLYSLFNSQGGVSTFKTKQKPMVYWGDILSRGWTSESTREEGGIRSQSNSDTQMYTFLDEAQRYIDMTAKGYYSHEYTKVLPKLKLFGKSNVKMNASFIPRVVEYRNADGSVDVEKTKANAGLDENGNLLWDGIEGVNPAEALMLMEDAEYSKSLTGISIGYSDNHILKLLDEPRIQLIIGFHDKTDNPDKRYVGAKYSKNYNKENEATRKDNGATVHDLKFNKFVADAEKMFSYNEQTESFEGTATFNGKEYKANDIPKLAVAMYLDECDRRGLYPAYSQGETDFSTHENYYKLLGDFGLYDSQGNYAPHRKVVFSLPDQVPYLDENGNKAYMNTEDYILQEVKQEIKLMDAIAEAMADESEDGIMAEFVRRVNGDDGARFNIAGEENDVSIAEQQSASDFVSTLRNIVKERGSWRTEDVVDYVDSHKEMNFIDRIYEKDKTVKKELAEFLNKINDVDTLEGFSWYMEKGYSDKERVFNWDTMKASYPYRGAVRTFHNAVKKRINDILTERVGGTNLGVKNGDVSLDEIKSIFDRMNSIDEIGTLAEKVFDTANKLGVNTRFVNQTFSSNVAGDALGDMVEYKTSYFNDTAVSDQSKAKTILHELIHACTVYVMHENQTSGRVIYDNKSENYNKIANAATKLNAIYYEISSDSDFKGWYGIKNPYEMVAELSNDKFVELLKKKTLWQRIIDAIAELFGFSRGNTAYDNIKQCLDYILDNPEISEYKAHAGEQRWKARREGYDVFGQTVFPDGQVRYNLAVVEPIAPTDDKWQRDYTEKEVRDLGYPIYEDAKNNEEERKSDNTQIKSTVNTYASVFEWIKKEFSNDWKSLKILDASSGLGFGTQKGKEMGFDVTDIEPYPQLDKYALGEPTYTDYSKLQKLVADGEVEPFDIIISNAVLNVIPQDTRDNLVKTMDSLLKPGGMMFINVRGANESNIKNARIPDGDTTGTVLLKNGGDKYGNLVYVYRTNSVQKGFTPSELKAYLNDALPGYSISKSSNIASNSVIASKPKDNNLRYNLAVSEEENDAYMDAYYDGDEDKAMELVEQAAKKAGYNYKAFHHTENAFTVFDLNKARTSMDIQGIYFSADPNAESEYGSVRYDTFLKMNNPYIVDSKETQNAIPFDMSKNDAGITARKWLQDNGYDSVIRKAEYFGAEADEYIVFDSTQIKSAEPFTYADDEYGEGDIIPLSERFNPENDDIRWNEPYSEEDRWTTDRDENNNAKTRMGRAKEAATNVANKAIDAVNKMPGVNIPSIEGEQANIDDIIEMIKESFGIPISTGKVTDRNARGIYKVRPEVIRTRIANNLPTISHELGYHLDKLYNLSKLNSVKALRQALPKEFLDQYSESERNGETVAEFVRRYLKNTNEAKALCNDFYIDFVKALSKDDLKAVDIIANISNEYLSSSFADRVQASIVKDKDVKQKTTISEKAKKMHTDWIDSFAPIKDAVDYVEETTGMSLQGYLNAYKLATNSLNARAIANFNSVHGFRAFNGKLVPGAKSYLECIADVHKKDLDTLDEYLVLKHSLEWIAPKHPDVAKKRVFGDDTLEDVNEINKRIAEIEAEHPEMKTAAENLYEYQRNLLKYFVIPSGGMTVDTYNSLIEKYPCYVPFYRAVEDGKKGAKTRGTFANQKLPFKRAKGSGESIMSPLENIIKNTDKFAKFALRNQTMDVLAKYADTVDGFGKFMEQVPPDMLPHTIDISRLKSKFEDALQQVVNTGEEYFAVSGLFDEIFGNSVTDFTPIANAKEQVVTVLRNGEVTYYQIHDNALYNAIAEFTPRQLEGALLFSHELMQRLKILMTQNNPFFATTNAIRDIASAYKHSPINNPIEFAQRYALALKEVVKEGEMYKQWQAMGGGHNSEMSANLNEIKRVLNKVASKDMGKARRLLFSIMFHPLDTIASLNDYIESTPRLMEFVRTLDAGGDLQEAIYNADDITTNFKRKGSGAGAKFANATIMFNNAALQGLDKARRTITNKDKTARAKTLMKWAVSALVLAAIQSFWNKENDEEGYENLSSYKKNNFYNFSIGDGKFISIPKARELALLDSFTERAIEYAFGNKEAFYDFGGYVADQLLPPMIPSDFSSPENILHSVANSTVLGGVVDLGFNRNFMGTPIESAYDEYLPSNERYNENTSAAAYHLGQTKLARKMKLSPKKIDHLMSSYLGFLGSVNKALLPVNPERRDVTMGLRNKFVADSNYSTDLLNKMYDNRDNAKFEWQYDSNVDNAIQYEQNATITSYISGMNKAIKAMPADEQREGRKYLLKALNNWNYDTTASQKKMQSTLKNESVGNDYIVEELPSSKLEWTKNKQKYTYQMSPEEYDKYINDYLKAIELARKQYGNNSLESYGKAKQAVKDYMSKYKKGLTAKYQSKATKVK